VRCLTRFNRQHWAKDKAISAKCRKTRKQLALELGVSLKTLWGWETNRWQPSALLREQIGVGLADEIEHLFSVLGGR
jgi:DNA-binding XRE family transcriptional regulator